MKETLKKIINGALLPLNMRVIKARQQNLSGQYLFEDLHRIISAKSPTCIDVGANEGQTIEALRGVFEKPLIYAFEPASETFKKLEGRNFSGDIKLYNCALGPKRGELDFYNYVDSKLSSVLSFDSALENPFREVEVTSVESVQVETVDDFIDKNNIERLDLLKIDTQGFDFDVIKGAERSLAGDKIDCILIELNFIKLYLGQPNPSEVIGYLANRNIFLVDLYEKNFLNTRLGWCTALFVSENKWRRSQLIESVAASR